MRYCPDGNGSIQSQSNQIFRALIPENDFEWFHCEFPWELEDRLADTGVLVSIKVN